MGAKYIYYNDKEKYEIEEEKYYEYKKLVNRQEYVERRDIALGVVHLDAYDSQNMKAVEQIPAKENIEKLLIEKEQLAALNAALGELTNSERELIEERYYKGEKITHLAKKKGVSYAKLHLREKKVLAKLKRMLEKKINPLN